LLVIPDARAALTQRSGCARRCPQVLSYPWAYPWADPETGRYQPSRRRDVATGTFEAGELALPRVPSSAQRGVTMLRRSDGDAHDRGNDVPVQARVLGLIEHVGLKPVKVDPQLAEQDEARSDVERVGRVRRAATGSVSYRDDRPDIVRRVGGRQDLIRRVGRWLVILGWDGLLKRTLPGVHAMAVGQPKPRALYDDGVRSRNVVQGRKGRKTGCCDAFCVVFEHG
jgi:hypothetical protein